MEVILVQDVKGLGKAGEVKRVSDGYARNYLIPEGIAKIFTPGAKQEAEIRAKAQARRQHRVETEASAIAEILSKVTVTFKAKAGEKGRLYGSITAADIAEAVERKTGQIIDRRKLILEEPIREIGTHRVGVKLLASLNPEIEVIVEPEE